MRNLVSVLALLATGVSIASCGEDGNPLGDLADQCGFSCKTLGDAGGSISGMPTVDAFFSAVLNYQAQAGALEADVRTDLVSIAAAIGVEGAADIDTVAELQTAISAQIDGGLDGMITGGLEIVFVPPKCEVSASASVQAAARCDAEVDPGSVEVSCEGTCEVEASAMLQCEGNATLTCRGTAPSFDCSGECHGSCVVEGGASCSGTCMGTCMIDGSAACDGECLGTETGGMCNGECRVRGGGSCSGTCMGSCELTAPGATCSGECRGECTYTAPSAGCEANAKARCEASAGASVMCRGMCEGNATPPSVKAECEATARAEAQFSAECNPPSLEVKYELTAAGEAALGGQANVDARAEFEGRIQAVGRAYASLLARGAKVDAVLGATADLATTGRNAVRGVLDGIGPNAGFSTDFNATCAVAALPDATTMITAATGRLQASATAVTGVSSALAGS